MHATRAARVHRPHSRHHSHMVCYGSSRPRQGGADSHDNEGLGSSSSYDGTSAPVKLLVSGLTAIVNSVSAVFDAGSGVQEKAQDAKEERPAVTVEQLVEGLKADYVERNYLWT
eukprot:4502555-Pyramimonas_sp.AAC.3